jgi:tetratricopeptide (TPR) repeat protein
MHNVPQDLTKRIWLIYAIGLAAVAYVFYGSVGLLGLDVDDAQTFAANELLSQDFAYIASPEVLFDGRPTRTLVTWLGYASWGNTLGAFHYFSAFVHYCTSFLIAVLCRQTGLSLPISFVAGFLFLIHVSHFQAIHWISALHYPLYLLFGLVFLCSYMRFSNTGRMRWMVASTCSLLIAIMAHIAALSFVVWGFYWSWRHSGKVQPHLSYFAILGFISGLFGLLALSIASEHTDVWRVLLYMQTNLSDQLVNAMRNLLLMSCRLLTMAHWAPYAMYKQHVWELYVGGFVLVVLAVAVLLLRCRFVEDWLAWIFLTLCPFLPAVLDPTVSSQLPQGPSRFLYAAAVGVSVLFAFGLFAIPKRLPRAVVLVVIIAFRYIGVKRVEAVSFYASGNSGFVGGESVRSIEQLRYAIDRAPEMIPLNKAYLRLGETLLKSGQDPLPTLIEASNRLSDDVWIAVMLAAVKSMLDGENGEFGKAMLAELDNQFAKADQEDIFKRNVASHYLNISKYYAQQRHRDKAIRALQSAALYNPVKYQSAVLDMSMWYLKMADHAQNVGELEEALIDYRAALTLDGTNEAALVNYGWALYRLGRFELAKDQFGCALSVGDNKHAQFNIGLVNLAMGNVEEAEIAYALAIGKYGSMEGRKIGALHDLEELIDRRLHVEVARSIINKYWQ